MAAPTADLFSEVLSQDGSKWFEIGVYLGASVTEMEIIKHNHASNGVVMCLIELHECLVRKGKPLTWEATASALRRLGNNILADSIHSNYILPATIHNATTNTEQDSSTTVPDLQHESATTTDPQHLTHDQVATPSDTTQQQLVVLPVYDVGNEFWLLFKRYASFSSKIRRSFKASNVDVDDLQDLIETLCGFLPLPQNEASMVAVFDRLRRHCSILNFKPLTFVVDELLSHEKTLRKDLMKLEKAMDGFKRSAKMTAVVNLIESHYESIHNDDKKNLKLKVQDFWKNFNLKQFEIVIKEILGAKLLIKLSHITVGTGCICVSWNIPPSVDYSKLLPKLSLEFLQIIGVISLHIGDDVIYNVGEEGCQTLEAAMLQATELKNTRAIELLLAVGCSPEVATYSGDHVVTNVMNIRERSVDDGSGGGVDHVCVLGHNEHIEAIVDTDRKPECATCRMKETQIKQLYTQTDTLIKQLYTQTDTLQQKNKELTEELKENEMLADTLQQKNKQELKENEMLADTLQQKNKDLCLENETLSSEYEAYQVKKDAELTNLTERLKFKGEAEDSTELISSSGIAESKSLNSALTEQIKSKDAAFIALMREKEQLKEELKLKDAAFIELTRKKEQYKDKLKLHVEDNFKPQKMQDISVAKWKQKIKDKLKENKQGIVFIVGKSDASGTEKDILDMQNVFARLNFALFLEHNLTANDMRNLTEAIAAYPDFPIIYKYITFYYAGHGGITPNGDAVLKPVQDSNETEFVFVERDIIRPIEAGLKNKCLLFFFDCCLSVASGVDEGLTPDLNIVPIHNNSLVAYASSVGEKAFGDKNGGYWTKTLVKHLERNERLVTILSDVSIEVQKGYKHKCTLKDNLATPVNLKVIMSMAQLTLSLEYGDQKAKLKKVPGDISVADLKTRAAEKFDIVGRIHLQYYDEDDKEWLVWSMDDGLVDKQKLKVVKQDDEDQANPGNPGAQKVQDISVARWKQKIEDKLKENKQGIVFIVGMSDASGTEKDILDMQNVFDRLNFALFLEHNLTANDTKNLTKAIAAYPDFSIKYKYIIFYYAGHGGITPNGDAVLKPVQDSNETEFVFVERDIIRPIEAGLKNKCLLFFFDCCLSVASGVDEGLTPDLNIVPIHNNSLVAYASSVGEKAFGDKNGGFWTKTLVKHLERNERLVTILSDVSIEVRKGYKQKCTLKDNLATPVNLKASVRPQEESLLKKEPHLDHVVALLKSRAVDYQKFGRALKVSHQVRESIKMDLYKPTFEDKLDAVIKEWMSEQTSDVTWEHLIEAMIADRQGQLVREIGEYLKKDDIKASYADKPEWTRTIPLKF